jgi:hypothetical protein
MKTVTISNNKLSAGMWSMYTSGIAMGIFIAKMFL